jgi:hypothetical protein
VTLTVTDVNGNVSTATATVTVEDNIAPVASAQNVTVQLDADGNGSTTAALVNNGSSDACGIASLALSQTDFNCSHAGAPYFVVLTVTDVNGNVSTATATVTVEDNIAPVASAQNVTVQLGADGNGSTTAELVDNGSSDACDILSLALSKTDFDCSHVGAPYFVTLTVTDVNSNVSSATATVTVEDNINPTAICQNLTVELDASGNGSITATQVDNGSFDNCGISTISLDNSTFTCADLGSDNTVTLTVLDVNGNESTCTSTITVEDNINPEISAAGVNVYLDENGVGSLSVEGAASDVTDNCSETWTVRNSSEKLQETFEMWTYRRMLKFSLTRHLTN